MKKMLVFLCAATLFFGIVVSAHALPTNGGFETGDLTGWNWAGDVTVATSFTIGSETYNPTEGNYLAKLGSTADSGVWFDSNLIVDSFDVIVPNESSFSAWIRSGPSNAPKQEFTQTVFNDSGNTVAINLALLTFNVPEDWCVTLYGVGVDLGETIFVDNVSGKPCPNTNPVPEPSTMLLLGSGIVGLAGWSRKKFKKN